jgi:hypothetical protein
LQIRYNGITATTDGDAAVGVADRPPKVVSAAHRTEMGYAWTMGFSADELELLDRTEEVAIETTAPDGVAHRTIIWAVVVDGDVFVRSYRGPKARWYREALERPDVAVVVDERRLPAQAVRATDARSIERTSTAILAKYAGDPAAERMVRPEILDLTLRLERS